MVAQYPKFKKNQVLDFFYDILIHATYPGFKKKSYGKSKFQVAWTTNLTADSDSSQKTDNWKCLSFLKIRMGTLSKLDFNFQEKGKFFLFLYKVLYGTTLMVFLKVFLMEYLKKKDTFNYQFFVRIPNLQSDMKSKQLEN